MTRLLFAAIRVLTADQLRAMAAEYPLEWVELKSAVDTQSRNRLAGRLAASAPFTISAGMSK